MKDKDKMLLQTCTNLLELIEDRFGTINNEKEYSESEKMLEWAFQDPSKPVPLWADILLHAQNQWILNGGEPFPSKEEVDEMVNSNVIPIHRQS